MLDLNWSRTSSVLAVWIWYHYLLSVLLLFAKGSWTWSKIVAVFGQFWSLPQWWCQLLLLLCLVSSTLKERERDLVSWWTIHFGRLDSWFVWYHISRWMWRSVFFRGDAARHLCMFWTTQLLWLTVLVGLSLSRILACMVHLIGRPCLCTRVCTCWQNMFVLPSPQIEMPSTSPLCLRRVVYDGEQIHLRAYSHVLVKAGQEFLLPQSAG